MAEEKVWVCLNCGYEFGDPEESDSNVKIIQEPAGGRCLIEVDGRVHSLVRRTWEKHQRQIEAENHCLKRMPVKEPEQETTDSFDDFVNNVLGPQP